MSKQSLDQYYTPIELAREYAKLVVEQFGVDARYIEPSAGTGVFVDALRELGVTNIEAYDLDPKRDDITQQDFFELESTSATVAIGNPPFGKGGSLAIRFMNHLVTLGVTDICFINPACVGNKLFTLKQLHTHLHIGSQFFLPENFHFTLGDGSEYGEGVNAVNCMFQWWTTKDEPRDDQPDCFDTSDFEDLQITCTKVLDDKGRQREQTVIMDGIDFVVTSHGKSAGKIVEYEPGKHKANVKRFIRVKPGVDKELVKSKFERTDWTKFTQFSTIRHNPSLSPTEMVLCYETSNRD